jgi:hypothetical protein
VAQQKGGISEFVVLFRAFPQHFLSAVLIALGIYLHMPSLFRTGVLGEFAYEFLDLFRTYYCFFSGQLDPQEGLLLVVLITAHHGPGIVVIIPALLCCSEDETFQQIPYALLAFAWLGLALSCLSRTCDINSLQGRTQIAVYQMIVLTTVVISRFYWLPIAMYHFVRLRFSDFPLFVQCVLVVYGVLITFFNVMVTLWWGGRLKTLMFGKTEKERVEVAQLLRQASQPMPAARQMWLENFSTELPDSYKKPKFQRFHTTPHMKQSED